MKEELLKLKENVENVTITYDFESAYYELLNLTIDYQNETQDWSFENIFEDYIDDEMLQYAVENNLKEYGIWAVKNLLDDINNETGIYKIDAYGYGSNITSDDLENIKEEILDTINDKLEEGDEE